MLEKLRRENKNIDVFGRGFNYIYDKMDAHAPYRYSIVVENSLYPYYWTEKLADCFLGYCVPVYIGAKNIDQYFPKSSIIQVAPKLKSVLKTINELKNDDWDSRLPALTEARTRALTEHQMFPFLARQIREKDWSKAKKEVYFFPKNSAPWEGGKVSLGRKLEYRLRKIINLKPY